MLFDGQLYFVVGQDFSSCYLYVYDKSIDMVLEIVQLDGDGVFIYIIIEYYIGNIFYFFGFYFEVGDELFIYIVGSMEIEVVVDINIIIIGFDFYGFMVYNGKLYFGVDEANSGWEIWVYNLVSGVIEFFFDILGSLWLDNFVVQVGKFYFLGIYFDSGYGLLSYDDVIGQIVVIVFLIFSYMGYIIDVVVYDG